MKLIKEFLFKVILYIIIGLIYYYITKESFFSSGLKGFIFLGLSCLIVEIIYYLIDKKTNIFKK